jgi:hypothetical protein
MAFLTEQDLHTTIYPNLLDAIKQQDVTIVAFGVDSALEEAEGYLKDRYDTETIFAKTGNDRNPLLLMMCRDIAAFNIIGISNPGVDYEDKQTRAQNARSWLKHVQKGTTRPNLPEKPKEEQVSVISSGSNRKRTQHY